MKDKCTDCGAEAEIYISGTPICLICAEVRDAGNLPNLTVMESLNSSRAKYRLALADLKAARILLEDLQNRDGTEAFRQAMNRFTVAHEAYLKAATSFVQDARSLRSKS
jgi:hypothetical protein